MTAHFLCFRAADIRDVNAIVALVESAYRGDASRAGWTTEAALLEGQRTDAEEVGAWIFRKRACVLLCFDADELCGSLVLSDYAGGKAYLGMFAVSPQKQARGVGRALLDEAALRARRDYGAHTLRMTVLAQRPELIAWYERRGFRQIGVREAFPYGDQRFGLPLRQDLYFEVLERPLAP